MSGKPTNKSIPKRPYLGVVLEFVFAAFFPCFCFGFLAGLSSSGLQVFLASRHSGTFVTFCIYSRFSTCWFLVESLRENHRLLEDFEMHFGCLIFFFSRALDLLHHFWEVFFGVLVVASEWPTIFSGFSVVVLLAAWFFLHHVWSILFFSE